MKFRIIGSIVIVIIAIVLYAIFSGGSDEQTPAAGGNGPTVSLPQ